MFTGAGHPRSYLTDEDDRVLIERGTVERLGLVPANLAYLDAADVAVPALTIVDEAAAAPAS